MTSVNIADTKVILNDFIKEYQKISNGILLSKVSSKVYYRLTFFFSLIKFVTRYLYIDLSLSFDIFHNITQKTVQSDCGCSPNCI